MYTLFVQIREFSRRVTGYVVFTSNVLLNKTFRAFIGIHAKSQTLFLFGTLLMEFSIHKKFQNKLILFILIA